MVWPLIAAAAPAVIGGVMSFLGGEKQQNENTENTRWATFQNQLEAERNRAFQMAEAEKNRQWQETQATTAWNRSTWASNTAYERAMVDMKRAGLNPILAYQQGGASSPNAGMGSGAQASGAQGQSASPIPAQNIMGNAANSALHAASQAAHIQNALESNNLIQAQTAQAQATEARERATASLQAAQTVATGATKGLITRQSATEAMRPAAVAAETVLRGAQAGASSAEEAFTRSRETQQREETDNYRRYGPPGSWRSNAQGLDSVIESLPETLDRFRRGISRWRPETPHSAQTSQQRHQQDDSNRWGRSLPEPSSSRPGWRPWQGWLGR